MKFKVGDRVRSLMGWEGEVTAVMADGSIGIRPDDMEFSLRFDTPDVFMKIEPPPPCVAPGCNDGWVTLFTGVVPCDVCNVDRD